METHLHANTSAELCDKLQAVKVPMIQKSHTYVSTDLYAMSSLEYRKFLFFDMSLHVSYVS